VTSYEVTVSERVGVGLRALRRDRMLFHQELLARIAWRRDAPSRVEFLGARQGIPIALRHEQVPDDLENEGRGLVINPAEDYLRLIGATGGDGFSYPIREGGEADYRYASGDTTTIALPDGRSLRLLELRVSPRRSEFKLMRGSLWFDAATYGLVRAVFEPARPFDLEYDGDPGDGDDVPGLLKPVRVEVRYITLEYGLYEFRWWMPRYVAVDGEAQAGPMKVPVRFERVYEGYRVEGGTPPPAGSTFRPAGTWHRHSLVDSLRAAGDTAAADSVRRERRECVRRASRDSTSDSLTSKERRSQIRVRIRVCSGEEQDTSLVVVVPDDTASLLGNPQLGPPILDIGDVISESELRQLGREIGALPERPWQAARGVLPDGVSAILRYARYNRVEALSLGAAASLDFGRLSADGLVRLGVADLEPNFELGLTRPARAATFRLGAYRRLAAANPDTRPFGPINSFTALLAQRDDGEYYRTLGIEVTGKAVNPDWLEWRLYAERQRGAALETQASLPRLFSRANTFNPNIGADRADEVGSTLLLRGSTALSRFVRVGADFTGEVAFGTFDFTRGALTVRSTLTPSGPLALALEGAVGSSAGAVPVQSNWYLGGPATLRGYDGGVGRGTAFWRARAEVANSFPAFRVALFSDVGWAGDRETFPGGRPLLGGGVGFSLLDGIVRLDLSHAFRAPTGWRFDFYLDGLF